MTSIPRRQSYPSSLEVLDLDQNGQFLSIDDDWLEMCGDLLGRRVVADGGRIRRDVASLTHREDGGRIPNAGLFPAFRYLLAKMRKDLRLRITPALATLPPPTHGEQLWYPQIADFMTRNPLGQIGFSRGVTAAAIVGDTAIAFPRQKIVVVGPHRRQLDKIASILQGRGISAVSICSRRPPSLPEDFDEDDYPQVICTTPSEAGTIDFATADIVIVLDAYTCMQRDMQMTLSQIDARFRLYGLFDAEAHAAPSELDAAFAVFGPEVIRIPAPRQSRRATNVAFVYSTPPSISLKRTDSDFAAECFWHHQRRNRRIAQLAGQLCVGDSVSRRKFPDVAQAYPYLSYYRPSVTILADRPCHAVALSRELAGWPVIASDEALRGTCRSFRQQVRAQRRAWNAGTNQIVLVDAADQFRGETSDVIIWAGGGDSIDYLPQRWLGQEYAKERPLLIVDFRDQHNPDALTLSRCREHAYLEQDIYPVGFSTARGRLLSFLHRQPRERRS